MSDMTSEQAVEILKASVDRTASHFIDEAPPLDAATDLAIAALNTKRTDADLLQQMFAMIAELVELTGMAKPETATMLAEAPDAWTLAECIKRLKAEVERLRDAVPREVTLEACKKSWESGALYGWHQRDCRLGIKVGTPKYESDAAKSLAAAEKEAKP